MHRVTLKNRGKMEAIVNLPIVPRKGDTIYYRDNQCELHVEFIILHADNRDITVSGKRVR